MMKMETVTMVSNSHKVMKSQALVDEEGQVHNQGNNLLHFVLLLINLYMLSIERIIGGRHFISTFLN